MKILMLSPYVTINSRPKYTRNRTGFGYMVYDIARSVAEKESVDILLSDTRDEEFLQDEITFRARSLSIFLRHIFKCLSLFVVFRMWRKYRMSRGAAIRLLYYWLISGYYRYVISTGGYDVVHIHGCRYSTELWMELCRQQKVSFIVTLHGLNSFSDTISIDAAGVLYERDFLQRVVDGEIPITVIASGIMKKIESEYGKNCGNIFVVCNSFSFAQSKEVINVRKLYGIPEGKKILLYVGNLTRNKNQAELIKAFPLLPKELAENTYVLFLGNQLDKDYTIPVLAEGNAYASHFIYCGIVPKELTCSYYSQGDAVVLLSLSEGFGLSLVEGMHFGLPCM